MKTLQGALFCCFSMVCAEAAGVLAVSGHVGGQVSIHCSGSWTWNNGSEHHNMYFCKGECSRDNILIRTRGEMVSVTRRGRYGMEVSRGDGAFNVTIKRLKRADTGKYHCGVEKQLNVLHQEVNLMVVDASTVPLGSPPSTLTLQAGSGTLPPGSFASSTEASIQTATEAKTDTTAQKSLKDTTVVIIVSVSLALLVFAIIPLIFYGRCWSKAGGQHKAEESADAASTPAAVRQQTIEADAQSESSVHIVSQYESVYQALDPKALN